MILSLLGPHPGSIAFSIQTPVDPVAATVQTSVRAIATAVQALVHAMAVEVQAMIDPVATAIQSSINPIAPAVQPFGKLVSAVVVGPLRPMIQPLIDPIPAAVQTAIDTIAPAIQAVLDPIAAVIESIFHPVAPAVEPLFDAIAPAILPLFDILSTGSFIGNRRSGQENTHKNRTHHCRTFFQHDQPPFSIESAVAPSNPCGFIRFAASLHRVNASNLNRLTKKNYGHAFWIPDSRNHSKSGIFPSKHENPMNYYICINIKSNNIKNIILNLKFD
ncbi:MAG TPA: hypothetical protein ACFCUC_08750 [Desulfobacterales bacterium]